MNQPFLPQEVIRAKRDGQILKAADIEAFVAGLTDESVSEGQVAAFAMAVFFKGMVPAEQATLTQAMTRSGMVIDWSDMGLQAPVVDKHSTGGVGDKVSLMLAPIVAACGAHVPMISGRGLGHTGGTLDKLDSIPGYNTLPSLDRFKQITRDIGCSIIGQTGDLAPADKRFYAIRDTTATVESIPLITASILSKKLAAGLDCLVMDVKVGNGAFMDSADKARALAANIVRVAREAGTPTTAVLTDMDEVLGTTVGNALEVREAIDFLTGQRREMRLAHCTLELAAHMLLLCGLQGNLETARVTAKAALDDGRAAEVFARMVSAHGGPADLLDAPDRHLAEAPVIEDVFVHGEGGYLDRVDTRAIGVTVVGLGGGRRRVSDTIDPAVGLEWLCHRGSRISTSQPIARVHASTPEAARAAAYSLREALVLTPNPPVVSDVVGEVFSG